MCIFPTKKQWRKIHINYRTEIFAKGRTIYLRRKFEVNLRFVSQTLLELSPSLPQRAARTQQWSTLWLLHVLPPRSVSDRCGTTLGTISRSAKSQKSDSSSLRRSLWPGQDYIDMVCSTSLKTLFITISAYRDATVPISKIFQYLIPTIKSLSWSLQ